MDILHHLLNSLVDIAILLFEFMGVSIIIYAGIRGIFGCFKKDPLVRLKLAKGMAMGLEFKLGSEILRTVVVRQFEEILIVGCIILLRAALTFLIHWEIKNEEAHTSDLDALEKHIKEEKEQEAQEHIVKKDKTQ